MDTKTIRYASRPFAVTLAGVLGLEFCLFALSGADFPEMGAWIVLGAIRVLQSAFILWIAFVFSGDACIPGLDRRSGIAAGIARGLAWSAAFGAAAVFTALIMMLAGLDPMAMIGVGLPGEKRTMIVFFLVGTLVGPLSEELFFRGVIYGFLRRFGVLAAVAGSSALFLAAHLPGNVEVTHGVGAVVFAAAYEYEKNILVPVTIHVLGNLALFSTAFF